MNQSDFSVLKVFYSLYPEVEPFRKGQGETQEKLEPCANSYSKNEHCELEDQASDVLHEVLSRSPGLLAEQGKQKNEEACDVHLDPRPWIVASHHLPLLRNSYDHSTASLELVLFFVLGIVFRNLCPSLAC